MNKFKNTFATPLVEKAYDLHKFMFNYVYPYPMSIQFQNGTVSFKVNNIFQLKYIPFLLILLVITIIACFGSCLFLLLLKLFHRSAKVDAAELVVCLCFGFFVLLEWGIYVLHSRSKQTIEAVNHVLEIERSEFLCIF